MENSKLKLLWTQVKGALLAELPENIHPWINPLEVSGYDNGVLTVVTGQSMGRNVLKSGYTERMTAILRQYTEDKDSRFMIIYDEAAAKKLKENAEKEAEQSRKIQLKEQAKENLTKMQSMSNLNLKYKFESFVIGSSNKFAYNAALSVAKNPAGKYNPLFIYGKSGLGKTHLMQAIGHYTVFNNPKLNVKYTKTEDYINDYITNSRKTSGSIENMSKFNRKYTNIDIILIDDIQFIESKMKTMDNLQYTFDSLYNKGKQIVITSDRLPKEIPTLTAALCSRFEMGLTVELTPPELDTRLEIIRQLAKESGIVYEEEALLYIAENFTENVRELEGAYTKAEAYAEMNGLELTLNTAKEILKTNNGNDSLTFDKIVRICANYYGVSPEDIKSSAKGQKISAARHISVYLCRDITRQSFVNIAEFYNKKHTTVMYGYEKIKKEINTNQKISAAVREIRQALKVSDN